MRIILLVIGFELISVYCKANGMDVTVYSADNEGLTMFLTLWALVGDFISFFKK